MYAMQRRAADKAEKAPKAKGKKDPKAPKRALSAYMFFSQDWRERIKAENPDAGFGECEARRRRACALSMVAVFGTYILMLTAFVCVQVKSASSSAQSGRSSMSPRRRCVVSAFMGARCG